MNMGNPEFPMLEIRDFYFFEKANPFEHYANDDAICQLKA
jgi:hypothetical protein